MFKNFWTDSHDQEKQIFIEFIDWIYARWLKDANPASTRTGSVALSK